MRPTVTLTSDFGLRDSYVAEMKAVILSINPNTNIVDISHDIEKFDIKMAAYTLACATPYFPKGTIHVAVVDPGVGTRRRAILVQTQNVFYVGPDNGILTLATGNQEIQHIFKITNTKLMLTKTSHTFHGRDIFAPAAAHLTNGTKPKEFGPEIKRISTRTFATISTKNNTLTGEVLHIDGFGNIITNIRQENLNSTAIKGTVNIKTRNLKLRLKLGKTYADAKKKEAIAVIGSHGFLEVSVNQGNAQTTFKAKRGDKITLSKA